MTPKEYIEQTIEANLDGKKMPDDFKIQVSKEYLIKLIEKYIEIQSNEKARNVL
jgi:hypothetical protein